LTIPSRHRGDRKYFTGFSEVMEMPNLIEAQLRSYKWFLDKGLAELFAEINSIKDFTGKNLELFFGEYYLDKPKYDEKTAKERNTTFEAPLYVSVNS
jgi:DNA-directed RNA polymerase subunit beta